MYVYIRAHTTSYIYMVIMGGFSVDPNMELSNNDMHLTGKCVLRSYMRSISF